MFYLLRVLFVLFFNVREPRFDPLLANLKKPVASSLIPTTCDEPFFASYPLLMAILKDGPHGGVTHVRVKGYGDGVLEVDCRVLAILQLLPHDVAAQ